MGFFSRKRGGVVDLSDMQKRGLLKPSPQSDSSGVVDFSTNQSNSVSPSNSSSNDVDFLSGLASAGSLDSNKQNYGGSVTESLRHARRRSLESTEINELKLKLDDNEFKMRRMSDKIVELEKKIRALGG